MPTAPENSIKHLVSLWESLNPFEQFFVQSCAIADEPLSAGQLHEILAENYTTGPSFDAEKISTKTISTTAKKLQDIKILNQHLRCHPKLIEIVARKATVEGSLGKLAKIIQKKFPAIISGQTIPKRLLYLRNFRNLRVAIYTGDGDAYNSSLLNILEMQEGIEGRENPVVQILNNPFESKWMATLPLHVQLYTLNQILTQGFLNLTNTDKALSYLQDRNLLDQIPPEYLFSFQYLLSANLLVRGRFQEAENIISGSAESLGLRGWISFVKGDGQDTNRLFNEDLEKIKKINRNPDAFFTGFEGIFCLLALLNENKFANYGICRNIISAVNRIQPHNIFMRSYLLLLGVIEAHENNILAAREKILAEGNRSDQDSISALFHALVCFWLEGKIPPEVRNRITKFFYLAKSAGYYWLALEYANILKACEKALPQELIDEIPQDGKFRSIVDAVRSEEQWQRALRALHHASKLTQGITKLKGTKRLAWMVRYEPGSKRLSLTPKIQNINVRGE